MKKKTPNYQTSKVNTRVADPHYSGADPNPSFHFNVDPDPTFHFYADPDPASQKSGQNLQQLVNRPFTASF
jgi:hypothetical protein